MEERLSKCWNWNINQLYMTWAIANLFITWIPEMMQTLIGMFVLPGSLSECLIWTHFSM